jgi:hypothetical protein
LRATFERVLDLGRLELLMLRLPALDGSSLSINVLREDLDVSHKAVRHWLDIFERLPSIAREGHRPGTLAPGVGFL